MKTLKIIISFLGIALLAALIFAFFLDKSIRIEEKIVIQGTPAFSFNLIKDLKKWKLWSVWNDDYYQHNRQQQISYLQNQDQQTFYQKIILDSKTNSVLTMEIIETKPYQKIIAKTSLKLDDSQTNYAYSTFSFKKLPLPNPNYELTWLYQGDYSASLSGSNPLRRYMLFFTKSAFQNAQKKSLRSLKKLAQNKLKNP